MFDFLRAIFSRPKRAKVRGPVSEEVAAGYPPAPMILKRFPKYPLGCTLRIRDQIGIVDAIYADYFSALLCGIVPPNWWDLQNDPPSSKDQIFYGIVTVGRPFGTLVVTGAILAGENDVELVEGQG